MSDEKPSRIDSFLDLATALVIGLATVAGAFAAYQATLWSGQCLTTYNEGVITLNQANAKYLFAVQDISADLNIWMSEVTQRQLGQVELADYFRAELMAEDLAAADAWAVANDTIPFEQPEYLAGKLEEALELERQGAERFEQGRQFNTNGDNFTLITVLFTVVLFFGGIGATQRRTWTKALFLCASWAVIVVAAFVMALLPLAAMPFLGGGP